MKESIPYVALLLSIISLSVSIFLAWRDRSRIKAEAFAYRNYQTGEYSVVTIKIVNIGRRPITLRWLWGKYEKGEEKGSSLGPAGNLKLGEGDFHEESIGKYDGPMIFGGEDERYNYALKSLYIESSTGKKYKVKNSKKMILKVVNSKHEFGIRTH